MRPLPPTDPPPREPIGETFIPYNNIGEYASPGNPNLAGTPYQLSGGPGDLIDPIAQAMMKMFPEPSANMPNPTIYDNWIGSGASSYPNNQFDIKIDNRFSEKNLMSAKYSQQWSSASPYNCFGNFADPCAGGPNKTTAHLFTFNDEHTFTQNTAADRDAWLYAGRGRDPGL